MDSEGESAPPAVYFRPLKRKRNLRVKNDPVESSDANASTEHGLESSRQDDEDIPAEVRDAIKRSKQKKPRFPRNRDAQQQAPETTIQAPVAPSSAGGLKRGSEPTDPGVLSLKNRFVAQSGQVAAADTSKLDAWIEAEMAKSKAPKSDTEAATAPVKADAKVSSVQQRADDGRGLASTGKIHEIDLGQAARARTVNLTEAATKALDPKGQLTAAAAPAKSRKGHQRSSSDQRRDNMVDAIFSESKLKIYQEQEKGTTGDQGGAADERVAEAFEREFNESLQSRNPPKPPKKPPVGGSKEQPKGPKLGGSRSARAAMHAQERATTGKK